ncbi:MAG: amino acid racemase [Alphaproteobacteria bacterium]|nr:amino acid racemase [Alphaproteobacteria bacterium]
MKRIGILAHSAEGAALCFLEAVHEGERRLGAHFHPDIVMDIESMGASMEDWEKNDFAPIAARFQHAAARLKAAGADFWMCPDNTAHLAFEAMTAPLPLPGLHIAEVVADQAKARCFRKIGITGTKWTMAGPVYPGAFTRRGLAFAAPPRAEREIVQRMIFYYLVRGIVTEKSRDQLAMVVAGLKAQGCDAVVLGCTELPMLLNDENSPLPTFDSPRLLARAAIDVALGTRPLPDWRGGPLR